MRVLTKTIISASLFLLAIPAIADSPVLVRLRAIGVLPSASSSTISLIGGEVTQISNQVAPELDFSYFVTPQIAVELILATTRHSVEATNTALGSVDLGKVSVLPPTLTAQYHLDFIPHFKPYIGAGINYTYFYNVNSGPVATNIHYDSSFGPALQIGADFAINDNWSINADVKKIWVKSNVTVYTPATQLETNVHIDPWVVGLGVGYRVS
ncbi:OmpW family protein [Legionella qingyii]|uniref:OmpW family protein n=1 Tax=Legionella qingyii TaxID=2184757 RepID=A0A317TZ98_9GAMM|nr:OmpW family outer membrane protein [Legionella qingyii]PWY54409.1 OmpW family protein [Legionella qingyii]RUR22861.1 OmpW family protein [Legionella qingyii]